MCTGHWGGLCEGPPTATPPTVRGGPMGESPGVHLSLGGIPVHFVGRLGRIPKVLGGCLCAV